MASLADAIERHIKELFERTGAPWVEIRRVELAGRFACVPSQITYVLETRFTPRHGYLVESRRGGGGFIRILRLAPAQTDRAGLLRTLIERLGDAVTSSEADAVVERLQQARLIDTREAAVWRAAMRSETEWVPIPALRDRVRAALLRSMLMVRFMEAGDSEPY
ncbi:MAG TPA: CtsR family transcriptional regulator [Limnochordales bacterium]